MAEQLHSAFESSMDKTNVILKDIENAYGWPKEKRNQSYAALRTVLHLLRDRMPVQESVEFAAQLPVLVRGIYFEGWKPMDVPVKLNRDDFLLEVRRHFPYDVEGGTGVVQVVLDTLRQHVTRASGRTSSPDAAGPGRMIPDRRRPGPLHSGGAGRQRSGSPRGRPGGPARRATASTIAAPPGRC
jgi:uncharacterized protein (DUF2267 family)